MNSKVYKALVKLCVDICKRNGKKKLLWFSDKTKSLSYEPKSDEMVLTVHRWFANKSCPGNWLYARLGKLAGEVTKELRGKKQDAKVPYKVEVSITDLNIRQGPGTNYAKTGKYTGKGVFTITKEKSGKGAVKG